MANARSLLVSLALLAPLALAGCVGTMTDSGGGDGDAVPLEAPLAALQEDGGTFVAMTLYVEVPSSSVGPVQVLSVEADPLPEADVGFVSQAATVRPGTAKAVAALAVLEGSRLDPVQFTLQLVDGFGVATLELDLGAWDAEADVTQHVTLKLGTDGVVRVQSVRGSIPLSSGSSEARPTYGFLVWGDGDKREVLSSFPFNVHVPPTFPNFVDGEMLVFRLEGAPDKAVWQRDTDPVEPGARFEHRATPGVHQVKVTVPGHGSYALYYRVADTFEAAGTALAATGPVRHPVPGVNGAQHGFQVHPGAWRVTITLSPTDEVGPLDDLDLYVLNDQDQVLIKSATPGEAHEVVLLTGGLERGNYRVWVYAASGVDIPYSTNVLVEY